MLKKQKWKTYAFWIILTEAVGLIAGLLTREGTKIYSDTIQKPPLSPPAIVFPIVWVILYALMGVSAARISLNNPTKQTKKAIYIYLLQLAFNYLWSIIFFNIQAFAAAFFWLIALWVLILVMILCFRKIDAPAAYLQIPYLLWVSFAGYLNFGVWMLNK